MITLVPIEHPSRGRRGVVLRRGAHLGEASPLAGRSRETYEDVLEALARGEVTLPSVEFASWTLGARIERTSLASQALLESAASAISVLRGRVAPAALKLKLRARQDADVLAEIRALAPRARLRVDANRAFAREGDVPWDALVRSGVEWIEEPCPDAGSLVGTPVPIALDESVEEDAARALEAVADGRAAALVLKPMLLGARETLRIGRACKDLGGRVVVSHTFESEIGRRGAEQLARRLDPAEIHGLERWDGIDGYRLALGLTPLESLLDPGDRHADPALG